MQIPLRLDFENMEPSEFVANRVRQRVARLQRYYRRIIGCSVHIEAPHRHHAKGNLYRIKIVLHLPGGDLPVSRSAGRSPAHHDIYVAIRDAFDAAERGLARHAERQRGEVKRHAPPLSGRVTQIFARRGYGFVTLTDGRAVYFHRNSVIGGTFDRLRQGQAVRLAVAETESPLGPQATTIAPIGAMRLAG
jgi:ribosomal subunit interface protein